MDPIDYLKLLRRRWWIVATTLVLALGAAYLMLPPEGAPAQPLAASYTATHTLLKSPDEQEEVNLALTKLFATTGEVPAQAARRLGRPPEDGPLLAAGVQVSIDDTVGALSISVMDPDGKQAARTANAFAEAVQEFLRASAERDRAAEAADLQRRLADLQERVTSLTQQIDGPGRTGSEIALLEAQRDAFTSRYAAAFERLTVLQEQGAAGSPLRTLQKAMPVPVSAVGSPVPTSPRGRLGMAAVLGLLLGVGLVLGAERLDTRLRTREQLEEVSRLPVVAEIPKLARRLRTSQQIVTWTQPESAAAEAYRALRSSVLLIPSRPVLLTDSVDTTAVADWSPPHVVLVTSAAAGAGKTSSVVNLAATLAESGRSVIVLDADFRRPTAHRYLGAHRSAGLSDLLSDTLQGGLEAALSTTSVPDVRLVTSGTSQRHPAALLSRLGTVVAQARMMADIVLIDSAPLLLANDASDIVPHVDTVLVVAHAGRTTRAQAERASERLARLGVPVLGVVLQASAEVAEQGVDYYGLASGGIARVPRGSRRADAEPRAGAPTTGSRPEPAATQAVPKEPLAPLSGQAVTAATSPGSGLRPQALPADLPLLRLMMTGPEPVTPGSADDTESVRGGDAPPLPSAPPPLENQ